MDDYHWATLRDSVQKGGSWSGVRKVDLPAEFAMQIEEPIATAWGKELLKDLRLRTKEYAEICVGMAGDVVGWALAHGMQAQARAVAAQHEALQAEVRKFESVGREMARDMRQEVNSRLVAVIGPPIKKACDDFKKKGKDHGIGVKRRILDLYRDLPEAVLVVADEPVTQLLRGVYREARKEIEAALNEFRDPLTPLAQTLINAQSDYLNRRDGQRRTKVLAQLEVVRVSQPTKV